VEQTTPARKVSQAPASRGGQLCYNQLREEIMQRTKCSKRTAQLGFPEKQELGRNSWGEIGPRQLPWLCQVSDQPELNAGAAL
jgi:hypothetical protein